jgi:hypothetical protein
MKTAILATAFAMVPLFAIAQDVNIQAVTDRVAAFDQAFADGDMGEVIRAMPPAVKGSIAEQAGVTVEALETAMISQIEAAMEAVTVESSVMDVEAATFGTTSQGRDYALIPTTTRMDIKDSGRVESTTTTVAVEDEGVWYLMRIDTPQHVAMLTGVYPGFADITFEPGNMRALGDSE